MLHLLQTRDPESVFTDFVSPETQQVALSTSARWAGGPTDQIILSSLRHPQTPTSDRAFLLNTCGRLWCAGVSIDWSQLYADRQRRRVPLPTYPFERERYWSLPIGTRTDAVRTGQTQADRDSSWPLSEPLQPISESLQVPTAPENGWRPLRKEPDMAQWFSVPSWKLSPLPAVWTLPKQSKSCWLIFTDPLGLGTRLAEHLRGQQGTVITVQAGTQFRRSRECGVLSGVGILGEEDKYLPLQGSGVEGRGESATDPGRSATDPGTWEYTIRPENREDYDSLLNDISSAGLFPAHIIHMWMVIAIDQTTSGLDYSETAQTLGFSSLLFLTQALGKQKGEQSQEIAIISNNLQEVTGREVLCPARATALGVGKIAPYEYPHLSFRSIDIIVPATTGQALVGTGECPVPTDGEQLVDQIITELRSRSADSVVAYRGPHRWVRCVEPIRLEKVPEEESSLGRRQGKTQGLRQEGVYLITGGLGGIGLTVAEDLARRVNARLVLTGRTALPAREEWDHLWDKPTGYQDAEVSKIRQIKRLEELGAEVLVIQADVTDLGQMQAVVSQTQQRFGALHGVFHTAGIFADGLIQMRRPEAAANVLAPKVRGTLVLEAVLKNVQLDFLILFSSLAALIGELGRVDYCAANTFLDSFAFYHTTQRRVRTISINWDGWQEVGMSVKDLTAAQKALQYQPELQMQLQNGMLSREGVEVLRRIIAHGTTPQLIVSTSNILTRLGRAEAYLHPAQSLASYGGNGQAQSTIPPSRNGKGPSAVPRISHQRPHLQTAYVAPQNETQQHIADLWQKFLGIEKIGIHDNFIDLGGNSLLATQLITRLRDTFQVDLTLRTLFEEPTIARLTTILLQKKAEFIDDALLLQDIEDVEHLTDDEVQALLAADRNQTERTQNR